jgi:acetate kinase
MIQVTSLCDVGHIPVVQLPVLGGIDALIFTGGIGERSPEARVGACANFAFLGLKLDAAKNLQLTTDSDQEISSNDSTVRVLVIRTQENWAIARDCWRLARVDGA